MAGNKWSENPKTLRSKVLGFLLHLFGWKLLIVLLIVLLILILIVVLLILLLIVLLIVAL